MRGKGFKRKSTTLAWLVAATALLAVPATAGAARYAHPTGIGVAPCALAAPCPIHTAVESAPAGETVILISNGTPYNTAADSVGIPNNVTVLGEPGQPRPTISSSGAGSSGTFELSSGAVLEDVRVTPVNGKAVNAQADGAVVRRVYLETDNPGFAVIDIIGASAVLERAQVVAPGPSTTQYGVLMGGGAILRDSTVLMEAKTSGPLSTPSPALRRSAT